MYYKNGDKYEGDWKNDKFDGKGIKYYRNGDKYDGQWKNGQKNGYGIKYFKNGNKCEGFWKNGIIEIKGKLYEKYEDNIRKMKRINNYYNRNTSRNTPRNTSRNTPKIRRDNSNFAKMINKYTYYNNTDA